MKSKTGMMALAFLVVLLESGDARAQLTAVGHRPTTDPDLVRLQNGRFAEVVRSQSVYQLLERANEARRQGRRADALGYYEAFLILWPGDTGNLQSILGGVFEESWLAAAESYLDLLDEAGRPTAPWFAQSRAGRERYHRCFRHQSRAECDLDAELDAMLRDCPQGLFTPMAVAYVADRRFRACSIEFLHGRTEPRAGIDQLRGLVARVEKAGLTPEGRLLCLRFIEPLLNSLEERVRDRPTRLVKLDDVLRVSRSPQVRIDYLKKALTAAVAASNLDAARELSRQFLAEFPGEARPWGRRDLLAGWLGAKAGGQAERLVREWQAELPAEEAAAYLVMLGDHFWSVQDLPRAQALYEEASCVSPGTLADVEATLSLAGVVRQQGHEEAWLGLLKLVARMASVDSHRHVMDAGNSQSIAHEQLASYYMEQNNWQEALGWWRSWRPSSWCGTCLNGMQKRREQQIRLCRERLWLQGIVVPELPTDAAGVRGDLDGEADGQAWTTGARGRAIWSTLLPTLLVIALAFVWSRLHRGAAGPPSQ